MGDWVIGDRANIHTFPALSYSRTLLGFLTDNPRTWSVYSIHPHACNLRSPQGDFIALVSPQHGNGPFHIVLTQAGLAEFSRHVATQSSLTAAHLRTMVRNAIIWESRLSPLWQPALLGDLHERLQPYCQQLCLLLDKSTPRRWGLLERLEQGGRWMEAGLETDDQDLLVQGVEQLIGLGPGLTPLGDDWLMGFGAGLHLAGSVQWQERLRAGCEQALRDKHTTELSRLWLQHALGGEFGEPWHELAAALAGGQADRTVLALGRIAAQGATSGLAALAGLAHFWRWWVQLTEQRAAFP